MKVDLPAAYEFLATHARVLDRRRFELLQNRAEPEAVLAALGAYRNPDGGYGWGLEPDLRSPESQPGAALHAFEVFEEVAPATAAEAALLCDWLDSVSLPDGGLPFALPLRTTAGTAPWWQGADSTASALQITAVTAAAALRVAAHDTAVAAHPWLNLATGYCLRTIAALDETPSAYELAFAVHFLDAAHDHFSEAHGLLQRLAKHVPADGRIHVEGGTEDEALYPVDLAPHPDRPARSLFAPETVSTDLDRLESMQRDDGGWAVDYATISPAGALEWRGVATVRAIDILRRNGRI